MGTALWFCLRERQYRDFRYSVPFIVSSSIHVALSGLVSKVVARKGEAIYAINPIVAVIDDSAVQSCEAIPMCIFQFFFCFPGH